MTDGIISKRSATERLIIAKTLLESVLQDMPPAEKRGKWEEYCGDLRCDQCGNVVEIYGNKGKWNYCPNCGARMEET